MCFGLDTNLVHIKFVLEHLREIQRAVNHLFSFIHNWHNGRRTL